MNRTATALLPALLAFSAAALPADPVTVESRIAYADPAAVPPQVLSDCALDSNLPRLIQDQARGPLQIGDSKYAKGRVFKAWIIEVADPGQSAWSGRKSLTVEGQLLEAGKVIGTVTARSETGWGLSDSCGALNFAARVLARDIAGWLASPTAVARLGDPD